jgi:hypothetical protein
VTAVDPAEQQGDSSAGYNRQSNVSIRASKEFDGPESVTRSETQYVTTVISKKESLCINDQKRGNLWHSSPTSSPAVQSGWEMEP